MCKYLILLLNKRHKYQEVCSKLKKIKRRSAISNFSERHSLKRKKRKTHANGDHFKPHFKYAKHLKVNRQQKRKRLIRIILQKLSKKTLRPKQISTWQNQILHPNYEKCQRMMKVSIRQNLKI